MPHPLGVQEENIGFAGIFEYIALPNRPFERLPNALGNPDFLLYLRQL
mgnify:CR=1 FL=1